MTRPMRLTANDQRRTGRLNLGRCLLLLVAMASPMVSLAVNPVTVVYRADDRTLSQVKEAGGMRPWREGTPDDDLAHHFEGESIEDHSSNFVSTTSSLRSVVEHAASLARPNSEEPFDEEFVTHIYVIRPDANFFDVDASLQAARDASPAGSTRRQRLDRLIRDYTGLDELVARNGFAHDQILSHAVLNGQMLRRYGVSEGSPLFSVAFWSGRWQSNGDYDPAHDSDHSSDLVYTSVDTPRGYSNLVVNGSQPAVPISFTCQGVHPSSRKKRSTTAADNTCAPHQFMDTRRVFYDKKLLYSILVVRKPSP